MTFQKTSFSFGGPITPAVKGLLIVNAGIFFGKLFVDIYSPNVITNWFGLSYRGFFGEFRFWQIFTYLFLHDGFLHVISNLFGLWMFSGELELAWGTKRFLQYYFLSGIGAGICILILNSIIFSAYHIDPITIGASGAIFALLLAYGLMWPDRTVLWSFIIPIKMKYIVLFYGLFSLYGTIVSAKGQGGSISHIGHLGGLITGFILIKMLNWNSNNSITHRRIPSEGFLAKFQKNSRIKKKKKEIESRIEAKKIIDELLEKIARHGMNSLNDLEKKKLEWARRHYHPNTDTMH